MKANTKEEERNDFLRRCVPGDELSLECWDRRDRTVTVVDRIEKAGGSVVLKAKGHGTTYQIDVPEPVCAGAAVSIRWPSGYSGIIQASLESQGEALWTDTTAGDLGIAKR